MNICFVSFKFVCYFQLLFILAKIDFPLGAEGEVPQKCLLDLCASLSFQQHSMSFHGMKQDPVPGHLPVSASCFLLCRVSKAGSQPLFQRLLLTGCALILPLFCTYFLLTLCTCYAQIALICCPGFCAKASC